MVPKNPKGDQTGAPGPFGNFQHSICCPISKKLKWDPLETIKSFRKKSLTVPKNEIGHSSLVRFCMLRQKEGKTFMVQFPGSNGTISPLKLCRIS